MHITVKHIDSHPANSPRQHAPAVTTPAQKTTSLYQLLMAHLCDFLCQI
jgi:hypothetical protein